MKGIRHRSGVMIKFAESLKSERSSLPCENAANESDLKGLSARSCLTENGMAKALILSPGFLFCGSHAEKRGSASFSLIRISLQKEKRGFFDTAMTSNSLN